MAYRQSKSTRSFGFITALLLHIVAGGAFLVTRQIRQAMAPSPTLSLFDISPPASPPEPQAEEIKEAPAPVEESEPAPPHQPVAPQPVPVSAIVPLQMAETAHAVPTPQPPQQETARPRAIEAPPAPQVASDAPDSWEGRVLAHLNRHKHYPATAQARRDQGIAYIRFLMDREGQVLSIRLEQSSGSSALDREAAALPKRAQPLPRPPEKVKGDPIELVVPIEYILPR